MFFWLSKTKIKCVVFICLYLVCIFLCQFNLFKYIYIYLVCVWRNLANYVFFFWLITWGTNTKFEVSWIVLPLVWWVVMLAHLALFLMHNTQHIYSDMTIAVDKCNLTFARRWRLNLLDVFEYFIGFMYFFFYCYIIIIFALF